MSQPPLPTTAAPRWTTLALLGAAVLGLHLLLLSGGWTPQPAPLPTGTPSTLSAGKVHGTVPAAPTPTPPPNTEPPRAIASTVRWIVAAPAPTADAPSPKPRPAEKPTPAAKAPELATPTPAQRQVDETITAERPVAPAASALPPQDEEPVSSSAARPEPPEPAEALPMAVAQAPVAPPETTPDAAAAVAQPEAAPVASERLPPASPPASTQLVYDVAGTIRGLNYSASGTLAWSLADGRYEAYMALRVPLLGSRVQTSAGVVEASGLLPERFSDKSRSERAAHFDHVSRTIRFSNNRPEAALQPGAQDRLSLFMQLAGMLNAQPAAYPAGRLISVQVAGTSDAETWRFRVGEEETLQLPAGNLQARRLVREPREPRDSRIAIWLAPELAYLPVRIRITQDNGDLVDQQLSQMP